MMPRFQPLPDLSPEEYAALRDDIRANGQQVAILVDEQGNILDGHHRKRICLELGLTPRYEVRAGLSDEAKWETALRLNNNRRQLAPAQKREMIRAELTRDKARSDKQIAGLLGVDPRTVERQRHAMFPEEFPAPALDDIIEDFTTRLRQISVDVEGDDTRDNFALGDVALQAAPVEGEGIKPGTPEYERMVTRGARLVNQIVDRYVRTSNLIASFFERYYADYSNLLPALLPLMDWTSWRMQMSDWIENDDVRAAYVRFAPWLSLLENAAALEENPRP